MWFIEHENLSGGKREWIKPGSQRLYGRTTKSSDKDAQSEKQVFLDSKSISRKHMLLKVLKVPSGDGTKLHTKSRLEIIDLSCKATTVIGVEGDRVLKSTKDEEGNIINDSMILTGTEYTVKLSQAYSPFKITWRPTVITYAAKESKESRLHGEARSAHLHALDIKTSSEYVFNKTTHVVSEKRNLPKALCGLVSGAHIVTSRYLDAIIDAATSPNDEPDRYLPSRLEEDFDAFWPKEKEYVPPPGAEPVLREASLLEPNRARSEVFKGLTFIFLTEQQHGSLQDPISGGGGKALLYNLEMGKTQVDDYVEFVRNTAGEKKRSKAGNGRLPVITVRIAKPDAGMEEWEFKFRTSAEQLLGQRQIVQNEFLDAILLNDASVLNKPPSEAAHVPSSMTVGTKSAPSVLEAAPAVRLSSPSKPTEAVLAATEEPVKPKSRKRPLRRGLATSRFTGFDDYEPPTKTRKVEATQTDMQMEDIQESAPVHESYPISQARSQARSQPATQSALRRSPTPEDTIESADQMNELFPVAAAMRSRRAATRAASQPVDPETHPTTTSKKSQAAEVLEKLQKAKKKATPKEIDVKERLQTRVKLEEEKRIADEENLQQLLEGVEISEIRGLAQIEEMDIVPRTNRPVQQRSEVHSEGWNDDWNGRKNFKKFRRRGAEQAPRTPKVIVPYEEVPQKKGFGGSDVFFLEAETQTSIRSSKSKKKGKKGREDSSEDEDTGFTIRKRSTQQDVVVVEDSAGEDADPVVTGTASSNRASGRVAETQVGDTQTESQTQTLTQRGGRKRGAPVSVAASQPASKRRVISRRDESSDDEDTGFRFKRRT